MEEATVDSVGGMEDVAATSHMSDSSQVVIPPLEWDSALQHEGMERAGKGASDQDCQPGLLN